MQVLLPEIALYRRAISRGEKYFTTTDDIHAYSNGVRGSKVYFLEMRFRYLALILQRTKFFNFLIFRWSLALVTEFFWSCGVQPQDRHSAIS
ncbi:hypothetical protein BOM23_10715 [Erwinia sp. OLMDLW33]|nr:hypothetical protein BOM23_10715 [Erwinia sp. OLMDLW33]